MDTNTANTIQKINIACHNIRFYPDGHEEIHKSALSALNLLSQLLGRINRVNFSVSNRQLSINEAPCDPPTKASEELVKILTNLEIGSIIFKKGVREKEFKSFLRLLAGGTNQRKDTNKAVHIEIRYIDLDAFILTKQIEIKKTDKANPIENETDTYPKTSELPTKAFKKTRKLSFERPLELAKALNQNRTDTAPVMKAFGDVLTRHIYSDTDAVSSLGGKPSTTKGDQWNEIFEIDLFLKKLTPALRKQFLSLTYDQCAQNENDSETEQLLSKMDKNLIFEMLQQADKEKREISPSLFTVVSKVVGTIEPKSHSNTDISAILGQKKSDKMATLFDREKYEKFIEKDYDQSLKQMSKRASKISTKGFDLEFYSATLGLQPTLIATTTMLLSLIKKEHDPEDYTTFSNVLIKTFPDLLEHKEYSLLFRCFGTFSYLNRKGRTKQLKSIGDSAVKIMENKEFIIAVLNKIEYENSHIQNKMKRLLLTMSPEIIKSVIFWCTTRTQPIEPGYIIDLISGFKPHAMKAIHTYLDHSKPQEIYRIIEILKSLNPEDSRPLLKTLLTHGNPDIRLTAFETLILYKDKDAILQLSDYIASKDPATAYKYIDMAGRLKVKELNNKLVSMVKINFLSKKVHIKNIVLLYALGNIGASSSIPLLKKIIHHSWSVYPKRLREVKFTAYRALGGIPRESSMDLLKFGTQSKDKEIRKICQDYIDDPDSGFLVNIQEK